MRFALRPVDIVRGYRRGHVRPDLIAGLTVAVVAVPQTIAYASIAGLPPSYGLYTACLASIVGSLWGSSRFLSTGPTNAASILVLSVLAPIAAVGGPEYLKAASLMAVMAGVLRIIFGLSGLGMLVNFASRSVLVGFTGGAALLIAIGQVRHFLRLDVIRSPHLHVTVASIIEELPHTHVPSMLLGLGTIAIILLCNRFSRKLPGSLIAMIAGGAVVAVVGVERLGVAVVGEVPRSLPTFTNFGNGVRDAELISTLITGALAVTALGLVEAITIAREIARQSGERLDVNQELIGQGLANVTAGLFGGYACSGSFTRSAVNFQAGARTQIAGVFCGLFVLTAVLAFGPLAAYLPTASLAGLILLVAARMVHWPSVKKIVRMSRNETGIMVATFVCTLVFPLEFAVLAGIILSLGIYIYQSSLPVVEPVVPDPTFRHFVSRPGAPSCPQLAVMNIRGSLFFGAVSHVEDELLANAEHNPGQHLLLLRLHGVNRCDLSGLDVLEGIARYYRDTGGDLFLVRAREPVRALMDQAGFTSYLGADHFLEQEVAVEWLFENALDPSVCCYECEHRVFAECQALVKHPYDKSLPSAGAHTHHDLIHLNIEEFDDLRAAAGSEAELIDVREPEEFATGHIAGFRSLPLRVLITAADQIYHDHPVFLICRSGRRSTRAMHWLLDMGFDRVYNLKGGILSWKARGRPLEVD